MNRTALRLSTTAVLTGLGHQPFPTLAGKSVYDSRQDAISDLVAQERRPVVIVRTDEDQRSQRDPRTGQPSAAPIYRAIKLRIEISLMTAIKNPDGTVVMAWPVTDAGLELLEFQLGNALTGNSPLAMWWRNM